MARKKSGKAPAKKVTKVARTAKSTPKKSPSKKSTAKKSAKKSTPKKSAPKKKPEPKPKRKAKVFDPEPQQKQSVKRKPKARPLSKRELPVKYRKSLSKLLKDIETNSEKIDKLKRKDEKWAFEIDMEASGGGRVRSWAVFNHIDHFAQYLQESGGVRHLYRKHEQAHEFWNRIKLIRWRGTAHQWKPKEQKLSDKELEKRRKRAAKEAERRRKEK